jgi:hypothetical protein
MLGTRVSGRTLLLAGAGDPFGGESPEAAREGASVSVEEVVALGAAAAVALGVGESLTSIRFCIIWSEDSEGSGQ